MEKTKHNPIRSFFGNAFRRKSLDPDIENDQGYVYDMTPVYGSVVSQRPDRIRLSRGYDRSIVNNIYTRIALDASAIEIKHVKLDDSNRYMSDIVSELNRCLTLEPNRDQTPRLFMQDVIMSMFDEGCVGIFPVTWEETFEGLKIYSIRTAKIVEWSPLQVKLRAYNENTGQKEDIWMPKRLVAIIENPFYAIMNEPNSTAQRLIRKLNLIDSIDERSTGNQLDLLVQVPYSARNELQSTRADKQRAEIERQLNSSSSGIAYIDGSEKIIQLNRPVSTNMMSTVEYLTKMLHSQIGISEDILNGTADQTTMHNYESRVLEVIVSAIVDEMKRKFITDDQRDNKETIMYFRDPFRFVPASEVADIADKFTRNEVLSTNEVRQIIGRRPVEDKLADELRNKNLNPGENQRFASVDGSNTTNKEDT